MEGNKTPELERWFSLEEISKHLGVSKDTIRGWIKKKRSHFIKWEDNINLRYQKWMRGFRVVKAQTQTNKSFV